MDNNADDKMFQFMLKEYEMLYSKFEMHYKAVEKTIGLYFLIIGAIVSANSFFIKKIDVFSIFDLSEFQLICCFFIFLLGTIATFKTIEHRLLTITYVKNLNQNRKWFNEKIAAGELQKYSLFEASYKSPKYYKRFRHFYWEILGTALINCSFFAIFLVNIFKSIGLESKCYILLNWTFFCLIVSIFTAIQMKLYKIRASKEESGLELKGLA